VVRAESVRIHDWLTPPPSARRRASIGTASAIRERFERRFAARRMAEEYVALYARLAASVAVN
jgi:hypothetical protein